ncbi:MAG: class I SAM-dependent methyltransferase [Chloroflexi bacterium]|nr:class I SAM-dependent methyltransferase [Chloroflexota bacterium]
MTPTTMTYEAGAVSAYYDQFGEREWERLDSSAHARLVFHLHMHFLRPSIGAKYSVLDAGCGAGRFSVPIAQSGSRITLLDISPAQLALAQTHLASAGLVDRCDRFVAGDIAALTDIESDHFDTVVCYGGPLNYLFDRASQAAHELYRVVKPGGYVLVSVMSRWGVLRYVTGNERVDPHDFFGRPDYWMVDQVANTGNLPAHPALSHPPRHFFTSSELRTLLEEAGLCDVQLASAPSFSAAMYARLNLIEQNAAAWSVILRLEEQAYQQPGLVDTGEFLLARAYKPA